jgi:hypothetical protein
MVEDRIEVEETVRFEDAMGVDFEVVGDGADWMEEEVAGGVGKDVIGVVEIREVELEAGFVQTVFAFDDNETVETGVEYEKVDEEVTGVIEGVVKADSKMAVALGVGVDAEDIKVDCEGDLVHFSVEGMAEC